MSELDLHFSDAKKKKKTRSRLVWGIVVLVVLSGVAAGTIYAVIHFRLLEVRSVAVTGAGGTPADDIISVLKSRIRDGGVIQKTLGEGNILAWPSRAATSDLEKLPALISLSIDKQFFDHSISVAVEERSPFGIWCAHSSAAFASEQTAATTTTSSPQEADFSRGNDIASCWWFDKDGVLFSRSLRVEGSLIKQVDDYSGRSLSALSKVLPEDLIPHLFEVFAVLDASDVPVKEIRLSDIADQELSVALFRGPKLLFSLRFSPKNVLPVLSDLSSRPDFSGISYIDFRVENRAYYK